ncbi:MAG: LamG domain-containing protein, partial [Planctomycetes bacterium]|nr:LamG domain-containing protein [Planctomycetota bacterium]
IGVDGGSASGMVLIDDITLHAQAGEVITPVQPDDTNLVLHYTFDEGAGSAIGDSSGNSYSGTFESVPAWAPGVSGSAISLDGVGSYVDAPASVWSSVDTEFTVSFWAQGDATLGNNWGFYAGDAGTRIVSSHLPWGTEIIFDSTPGWADERVIVGATSDELTGQWRHWTMVRTAGGDKHVYLDGLLYGSTTATADPIAGIDRFFIGAGDAAVSPYKGLMDEFQVYNRALSAEEVLWNAGVTTPIDKPF